MMRKCLLFLNFFIGIGACFGGYAALSSLRLLRSGGAFMGLTNAALKNSPFSDFLIPGLFLALVIGGGNLLTGLLLWRQKANPYYCELLIGALLFLWIIVQVYMLQEIAGLHVIFGGLGLGQLVLALWVIKKAGLPLPFQAHQN